MTVVHDALTLDAKAERRTVLTGVVTRTTGILEGTGDEAWLDLVDRQVGVIGHVATSHGGTPINPHGDGFVVLFDEPGAAVAAALELQRVATERSIAGFRIGVDHGDVQQIGDEWWTGLAMLVATGLADRCAEGQIAVTERAAGSLGMETDGITIRSSLVELPGVCERTVAHVVTAAARQLCCAAAGQPSASPTANDTP